MKIIRWLFGHTLFILLIIAVIYAYMFWGNLLGEDTPAGKAVAYLSTEFEEVEEFVNAVKAKQAHLSETRSSPQDTSTTVTDVEITHVADAGAMQQAATAAEVETQGNDIPDEADSKTASPMVTQPPQPAPAQQPYEAALQADHPPMVQNTPGPYGSDWSQSARWPEPVTQSPQVNKPAYSPPRQINTADTPRQVAVESNTGGSFVPAEVNRQMDNIDDHGEIIDPSQPGGQLRETWITARKAYYQRNYALSEQSYRQVIDNSRDNFDAYGELGNVYFNQGKDKEAAAAYFEAAAILIKKGQADRARSLMGLMRHLDRDKAVELQQLLDAAR